MSRGAKKGPYIDQKLFARVLKQKQGGGREPLKTWARDSQIPPEFVGHHFAVHNGRAFVEVLVSENMVGHRLGEFAPTRTFRGHGGKVKEAATPAPAPAK